MLAEPLREVLAAYWRWKRPTEWLFPGTVPDRPIGTNSIFRACQKAARKAGITKPIHPHSLRHAFATHLLESGTDVRTIQLLLGHEDLEVTARYLHLSAQHLQKVVNPLEGLKLSSVDDSSRLYHRPRS